MRSQNVRSASQSEGSSRRIENASTVATANPSGEAEQPSKLVVGYVAHSGAARSAPNFVQPESATAAPRAQSEVRSQNPARRKTGMIASFVFEFSVYAVNG